jgi:hypothetical protein
MFYSGFVEVAVKDSSSKADLGEFGKGGGANNR